MHIWAIGDLHLSFDENYNLVKPMDIFSDIWRDHAEKIAHYWRENVSAEDTVLLAGDLSWALKPANARYDIAWINNLPGRKIAVKGNHDLWWQGAEKTKALLAPIEPVSNNAIIVDGFAICGAKGYRAEHGAYEPKIANREYLRLENSLKKGRESGKEILALLHYPPYEESGEENMFSELLKKYHVKRVIYGHLHKNNIAVIRDSIGETALDLVSADYADFKVQKII